VTYLGDALYLSEINFIHSNGFQPLEIFATAFADIRTLIKTSAQEAYQVPKIRLSF
jgi:hypothetical protein